MTTLVLVRHGETNAVGKVLAGRAEGWPLNETGTRQVMRLGTRLASIGVDAVCTSPLERSVETAVILSRNLGLPVEIDPGLNEVDFGEWQGRSFADLSGDSLWQRYNNERDCVAPPNGESVTQVLCRMLHSIERVIGEYSGKTVVLVSHCDPLRYVLAHWLSIPIRHVLRFSVSPASMSIVQCHPESVHLVCVNCNN